MGRYFNTVQSKEGSSTSTLLMQSKFCKAEN